MGIYEAILKAYLEKLEVKIVFKDGAIEPRTHIVDVYDEFDFMPSDVYISLYQKDQIASWRSFNSFTSADYDDVEPIKIIG